VTRVIDTLSVTFGVEPVCTELSVPVSTYYARKRREREPSARQTEDERLVGEIHRAREGYRAVYGVERTWHELRRSGIGVGRDRVGRLMRAEGMAGVVRGRSHTTTIRDESASARAADLVDRNFTATGPNQLWVADFTYLRSRGGFLYLAFILDVFSRMIVGWQLAWHMRASLVVDALEMAAGLRQPPGGLVAHTDAGSQYTSVAYTERIRDLGMEPSIGSVGDALDNAMAESWVGTIKAELIQGRIMPSFEAAEHEILGWISWYNRERLPEELGHRPPAEFEAIHRDEGPRPCGPPSTVQPALPGALAGRGSLMESL
jgi:transposase InsO family protein